jgi:large subunit ribosomal protein L24
MKRKIKTGDQVEVICGEYKGKRGEVLRIHSETMRLVVMGVNIRKKCMRKSQQHPDGAILEREMPIHYSNVRKVEADAKGE